MGDVKLKLCPFCGGKAIKEKWGMSSYEVIEMPNNHGFWYSIYCDNCLSEGSNCITEEEAIKAWNTIKPVVEIVYCKDCLYSQKVDNREPMYECNHICRMGCTQWLGSDDYCSYGERK